MGGIVPKSALQRFLAKFAPETAAKMEAKGIRAEMAAKEAMTPAEVNYGPKGYLNSRQDFIQHNPGLSEDIWDELERKRLAKRDEHMAKYFPDDRAGNAGPLVDRVDRVDRIRG